MTAKEKISLAITKLLLSSNPVAPFFSSCIMQIDILESNCKTMATDGKNYLQQSFCRVHYRYRIDGCVSA